MTLLIYNHFEHQGLGFAEASDGLVRYQHGLCELRHRAALADSYVLADSFESKAALHKRQLSAKSGQS
ncbi:hypothetical protein BLL42_02255 [Pseudomonas frederiksbergensis]|uniref:Uncharacterized protein n=1 Tax=Pseudomonas frederiksbergensis TaxID=104087 RepID=A0A1J0EFM9_9PSED|nr:hypothetical protein BLL42_02255 [Pseudomonas frederiksbergensis]